MTTTIEPIIENKKKDKPKLLPPYNVILMNDDEHTDIYVINIMRKIFAHPIEKGMLIAKEVHLQGRCIVWTGTKELAELKQEQIHSCGRDVAVASCKGSMTAIIEPSI